MQESNHSYLLVHVIKLDVDGTSRNLGSAHDTAISVNESRWIVIGFLRRRRIVNARSKCFWAGSDLRLERRSERHGKLLTTNVV